MTRRHGCLLLLVIIHLGTTAVAQPHHEVVPSWPQLPKEHVLGLCAGVDVDAQNRVFVFHRSGRKWSNPFPTEPIAAPTVSVIDGATGRLLSTWGAGRFIMPHGLTVDHEGNVWLTDVGLHQVFKCTPDGEVLLTLGEARVPGDDKAHFNLPTDVAVLSDGSFYVSDGYKNTRVMKFAADGRFEFEWGTKGKSEPGEFNLPHGVAVDAKGRVYVCDRENLRVQVFDAKGAFLDQWKGPHIGKPYGIATHRDSIFIIDGGLPSLKQAQRGKVVELDAAGRVLDSIGSYGSDPGQFRLGHDIAVGLDGAVYTAEGTGERVQKFVRRK